MNDIFKIFKKRAMAGKNTNITDVIKDLNEKEQDEIMNGSSDVGRFDRANKSYLSISKSGRLKSKKSQSNAAHRILNEDLFKPAPANATTTTSSSLNLTTSNKSNEQSKVINKPIYDPYSDNADSSHASSTNSSFRSSLEDLPQQQFINYRQTGKIIDKSSYILNTNCASNVNNMNKSTSNNYSFPLENKF